MSDERQLNQRRRQNELTARQLGASLDDCPAPDDCEAMTLTDDERTDPTADLTGGDDARRRPITDVSAWLDGLDGAVRPALRALGDTSIRDVETAMLAMPGSQNCCRSWTSAPMPAS